MGEANTPAVSNSIPRIFSRADFAALNIKERREPSDQKIRLVKSTVEQIEKEPDGRLRVIISTAARDRDKDTIAPGGWDLGNYLKNPVILFAHDHHSLPIGRGEDTKVVGGALVSHAEFVPEDIYAFAGTCAKMVAAGFMKAASVGFNPKTWVFNEEEQGYDFDAQELLEWSFVPVGSNPEALIGAKSAGIDLKPMKAWAEETLDRWQKNNDLYLRKEQIERIYQIAGGEKSSTSGSRIAGNKVSNSPLQEIEVTVRSKASVEEVKAYCRQFHHREPTEHELKTGFLDYTAENRWNIKLSKAFDVRRERLPAQTSELQMVAAFLDCEIKEVSERGTFVRSPRMGAFLSALNECLAAFVTDDIRNIQDSKEAPPRYDTIGLNSKTSQNFLIEGSRFLERVSDDSHTVVKVEPVWGGMYVTYFGKNTETTADDLRVQAETRAAEINYLKGEAFSLSGEFLERGNETWADVFLDPKNEKALKRTVELLNTKGKDMDSRGCIMAGPPGNGKTVSARVMMREAKDATFIWVSARDFFYAGAFGGTAEAFDIARECAPSIIVFEDIDNWWGDHSIDLLKTELDGLKKNSGVVTIITTNFPERLPKALIDRPGRFHDVLSFNSPSEKIRGLMLAKWLPEMEAEKILAVAKSTEGYSGAHIRDLARLAKIIEEQESLELDKAIDQALEKVKEQRELINQRYLSHFQASPEIREAFQKSIVKRLAELRAKAMQDCPNGESCPYQEGMDSCPAGENCAMKKTAASVIAAQGAAPDDQAETATETATEERAVSLHSHSFKTELGARSTTETFTGKTEDCPVCKRLANKEPPAAPSKPEPAAEPPAEEPDVGKANIRSIADEINRRARAPKNLPELSSVDSTVNTQNLEDRLKAATQRVVTRLTGRVF